MGSSCNACFAVVKTIDSTMRHITHSLLSLLALGTFAQSGSLDPTFGNNGKVLVPSLGFGFNDQSRTAVVLPDDRILVAGWSNNGTHFNSVLLRFNADGSPDETFGTNGLVEHDLAAGGEFIRSAVLDAQGRLVVGGKLFYDAAETNGDMFVARFLADGTLDASFNGTGLLVRDIHNTPDAETAYEVMVQPDGKLILCGHTGPDPESTEIVVERYLDNGGMDPTFGGDGSILVFLADATKEQVRGAVLGPGGDIYFCGYATLTGETHQSLLLGHLDANGNAPSNFGNANGHSWISEIGSDLIARAVALTPDGGLVVAGVKQTTGTTQARIIHTFDGNGNAITNIYEDNTVGTDAWNCLLVQNNGAIISGGDVADGATSRDWNVERHNADLSFDPLFATTNYDEDGEEETCYDLEFTNDSSIIGIGNAEVAGLTRIVLLKYLNDNSSSITDGDPGSQATVFPNPVADRTVLTFAHGAPKVATLSLMDAQGHLVRNWSGRVIGKDQVELDLSGLIPGVYGMRTNEPGSWTTLRIVKQ